MADGNGRWPAIIVALHWTAGILALAVAAFGIYLLSPPDWSQAYIDRYMAGIVWHKLGGLIVMALAVVWLAARRRRQRPAPVGGPAARRTARAVQTVMLLLLLALPASGLVMDAAFNAGLALPWGISLPSPLSRNAALGGLAGAVHKWGSYGLLAAAGLHAAAALRHAVQPGDHVMRAMLPRLPSGK